MPLSISMDVTNACNSRCKTCYFSLPGFKPKGRNMSLGEFDVIVAKLKGQSGILALSCEFEPLIHPDIVPILKSCAVLTDTWQIRVNTNGIKLSPGISRALVSSRMAEIYVSLDAPTPELNAKIRGNSRFHAVLDQIQQLRTIKVGSGASNPICILRATALRANLHALPDMITLCKQVGADRFSVKHVVPIKGCTWDGRPMAEQSCLLCPEETHAVFEEIRRRGKQYGIAVDLPPAAPKPKEDLRIRCGYVSNGFHVFPDGTCYPCVWLTHEAPYGNLLRDSLDAVLGNPVREKFTEAFVSPNVSEACRACLRDSQTVGIKAWNDARLRLEHTPALEG